MKHNFDKSFELVIGHEGGFTDDRRDRGNWTTGVIGKGELKGTKYGVSAMAYPHLDIKNLTLDQAKAIYKSDYWDKARGDDLPSGVDYIVFDMAINHGVWRSAVLLQSALGVKADGKIGPMTLGSIQSRPIKSLLSEVAVQRMLFYTNINTFPTYKRGWTRRAIETFAHALDMVEAPLDKSKPTASVKPSATKRPSLLARLFWREK